MRTQVVNTRTVSLLLYLFLATVAQGQTVFWGVGSANGVAEAEFQNAFVQSATPTYSNTAWTAVSIFDDDGTGVPGAAYWVRNITGTSQGAYATTMAPVQSPSQANGVALFDSDFMDNAGTRLPGGAGLGTSPAPHRGELVSPRIDLSAARDSAIQVEFFCQYRPFTVTEWSISMSIDDGLSWTTPTPVNDLLAGVTNSTSSGTVSWLLPNIMRTTTNLSNCRIKFSFEGRYYYYMVDDISIKVAPEYDLAIGEPETDGTEFFTRGNQIRMAGNAYVPYLNLNFNTPLGWGIGAKVINKGYLDMGANQNPRLICRVDHTPSTTTVPTMGVYYDTIYLDATDPDNDTIYGNDKDGIGMVKVLNNIDFIRNQINPHGRYDVRYWVEHDEPDGSSENDTIEHFFVVTDYPSYDPNTDRVGGMYHSKARLSNADGRTTRGGSIFPGGGPRSAFEYGSLYYFPTGATDSFQIDSVDWRYYLRSGFTGASSQVVFVKVYEFVDGRGGGTLNGVVSGDELLEVGLGSISLTGLGTTVPTASYGLGTCRDLTDAAGSGQPVNLIDGGFYYVSIKLEPSAVGGPGTFEANDVPTHAVDRINYAMNFGIRTSTAPFSPSTMYTVDAGGTGQWFSGFTGFDEVPSIGLFLSRKRGSLPVSTPSLIQQEGAAFSVFPNPTSDLVNLAWSDLSGASNDVLYVITEASGRVVYYQRVQNVAQDMHQVDVSTLAPGVYFVTAQTEGGVSTQRFVKQ